MLGEAQFVFRAQLYVSGISGLRRIKSLDYESFSFYFLDPSNPHCSEIG